MSSNNGGGGNWGADDDDGDITQIKTVTLGSQTKLGFLSCGLGFKNIFCGKKIIFMRDHFINYRFDLFQSFFFCKQEFILVYLIICLTNFEFFLVYLIIRFTNFELFLFFFVKSI